MRTRAKWTPDEIRSLKQQFKDGVSLGKLELIGRSRSAIGYQFRAQGFRSPIYWSRKEIWLLKQCIQSQLRPEQIQIPGRTRNAIRNKSIRLHVWEPKKRVCRDWSVREINRLEYLVSGCGYTARKALSNGYFWGRSVDSISQQMRRSKIHRFGRC